ncbi:MAG: ACP synthase, partial [Halanaeroarchaeum sp.]
SYDATSYERHAYAATIAGALEDGDARPTALAPSAPNGAMPYRAANEIEADPDIYERAATLGDTGAASPFFGLLDAWDAGASTVHVVGYGDGATANVVVVDGSLPVDEPEETVDLTYPEYLRYRGTLVTSGGGK